ncbi:MAG: AI-2E family transporter [Clostridia bacterium]|nr:AI-2E family transporter [Clostridia bacterium]
MQENKTRTLINISYFAVIFLITFLVYKYLLVFLLPVIIAVLMGYSVQKSAFIISKKINSRSQVWAPILVIAVYLLLLALIVGILFLIYAKIPYIFNTVLDTLKHIASLINNMFYKISNNQTNLPQSVVDVILNLPKNFTDNIISYLTNSATTLISYFAKNVPSFFFSFIITVIMSLYFAKDYNVVKKFVFSLIPHEKIMATKRVKNLLFLRVFKMLKGYLILSGITFLELFLAFLVLKIKNAFIYAVIISLIDALPVLGTGLVLLPWGIVNMLSGNIVMGVKIVIVYLIVAVVRNILEPKIIGQKMGIPPLLSLLIIFLGIRLFSFLGMIVFYITVVLVIDYYREQI